MRRWVKAVRRWLGFIDADLERQQRAAHIEACEAIQEAESTLRMVIKQQTDGLELSTEDASKIIETAEREREGNGEVVEANGT